MEEAWQTSQNTCLGIPAFWKEAFSRVAWCNGLLPVHYQRTLGASGNQRGGAGKEGKLFPTEPPYLSNSKDPFPAGHHLVPFVVQEVHEAGRLVAADELGDVGGQRRVLGKADAVAWHSPRELGGV